MLTKIKDKISRMAQRALGIDDMRFKLDVVSSKLDVMSSKLDVMSSKLDVMSSKLDVMSSKLDVITNGLAQLDPKLQNLIERGDSLFWQIRQVSEGLDRLRSFLTWSANRVEPWLPAENFSQTEPDYDLAGFLYNFFPSRVAVDIGAQDSEFAKALSEIGYQVFCFASAPGAFENLSVKATCLPRVEIFDLMIKASEMAAENPLVNARLMSPNGLEANTATGHPLIRTIASLVSSKTLPPQIDILKIDTGYADLEVIKVSSSGQPVSPRHPTELRFGDRICLSEAEGIVQSSALSCCNGRLGQYAAPDEPKSHRSWLNSHEILALALSGVTARSKKQRRERTNGFHQRVE